MSAHKSPAPTARTRRLPRMTEALVEAPHRAGADQEKTGFSGGGRSSARPRATFVETIAEEIQRWLQVFATSLRPRNVSAISTPSRCDAAALFLEYEQERTQSDRRAHRRARCRRHSRADRPSAQGSPRHMTRITLTAKPRRCVDDSAIGAAASAAARRGELLGNDGKQRRRPRRGRRWI